MELRLKRTDLGTDYTAGKLYVDGKYFCDTMEDRDRGLDDSMDEVLIRQVKVMHETAIPTGRYNVRMDIQSPRFKTKAQYSFCNGYLPRLEGVKGFEGVLIHIGNTSRDSSGCILVGSNGKGGQVFNSTRTFISLYDMMGDAADRGEKITLTVEK